MVWEKKFKKSSFRSRHLQEDASQNLGQQVTSHFNVSLFLELQYLNQTVAELIEDHDDWKPQIMEDLCGCLKNQVRTSIEEILEVSIPCNISWPIYR